jgi:hypothetical protein
VSPDGQWGQCARATDPCTTVILEMNGESYRLKTSRRRQSKPEAATATD